MLLQKRELDLTNGSILPKILLFILPLMASNFLQCLYKTADMIVVGFSDAPDAVGAIGTTTSFINVLLNFFLGVTLGTNILVSQFLGARNKNMVQKTIGTSYILAAFFGVLITVVGFFTCRSILHLMGDDGTLLDLATTYTQIYFLSTPFMALTNNSISIFRAKGDTKTPLVVLLSTGFLNVLLNILFVLGFSMDVDGVAWATVISNAVSAFILLWILMRTPGDCQVNLRKLTFDKDLVFRILYIGIPAAIQGILFSLSNMLIQSSILRVNNAQFSVDAEFQPIVRGNAAAANIEDFIYTASNTCAQATTTFVGQNYGARKFERIHKVIWECYLSTFVITVLFSLSCILFRNPLLSLYSVSSTSESLLEQAAYEAAWTRIKINYTTYVFLAFMEIGSSVLRALGRSITSTVVSLMGACGLRIVWLFTIFEHYETLETIYISYPVSWGVTAAIHFTLFMILLHKLERKNQKETLLNS